jgi:hypothetical protein
MRIAVAYLLPPGSQVQPFSSAIRVGENWLGSGGTVALSIVLLSAVSQLAQTGFTPRTVAPPATGVF